MNHLPAELVAHAQRLIARRPLSALSDEELVPEGVAAPDPLDRDALLSAVLAKELETFDGLRASAAANDAPAERIHALFHGFAAEQERRGFTDCPFTNAMAARPVADPEHPAPRFHSLDVSHTTSLLREAIDALAPDRSEEERHTLAEGATMVLQGGVVLCRLHRSAEPLQRGLEAVFRSLGHPGVGAP